MLATASRGDRLVPWIAGLLVAIPVLAVRAPPMLDLPLHEAVVGLLRHWGDPAIVPVNVYALNLGQPNQALYFAILALSYTSSIPVGAKLLVAATLMLLPVAAARVADHLGIARWSALLVAPVGLGWLFFYGLLANLMGLAAYLFALPSLDRFVDRPTGRGFGVVAAWLVLLHFTHDLMALAAGLTLVVLSVCAGRREVLRNVVRVAPAAIVVAAAIGSRMLEARLVGDGGRQVVSFASFGYRVRTFPDALFAGTGGVSLGLLAIGSIPLALFLVARTHARAPRGNEADGRVAWRLRIEILSGVFLSLYFVAPVGIDWSKTSWAGVGGQIYMRFLPLAWSLLAVTCAPRAASVATTRSARLLRLASGAACLAPLAPVLVTWPDFAASDRAYRALDDVAAHMTKGSAHALLDLDEASPGSLFTAASAGGFLVAQTGGRSLFDYTRSPASPVVERPETQWVEPYDRIDPAPFRFIPAHDLTRFRYVVLYSVDPGLLQIAAMAMTPDARVVYESNVAVLLESTLPRVPLDAPDVPLPSPRPASLGDRIQALAARLGASPAN